MGLPTVLLPATEEPETEAWPSQPECLKSEEHSDSHKKKKKNSIFFLQGNEV